MPHKSEASVNNSENDAEKLDKFKLQIIIDADAMDDQRDKANEDMRFVNMDGGMWEGFFESVFDHQDRVRLELDMTSNPVHRFVGEWLENRTGVNFKPTDAGTTEDDSELLNGIYRSDFRDFSGGIATDNAVMECVTVGYGAFKIRTEFDDEGDPENENQHVVWEPKYNAYNTIIWDSSALRIDKRDARHCTELTQFSRELFEEEWPGKDAVSAYTPSTRAHTGSRISSTTNIDILFVATRYQIVKKKTTVFVYNNLQSSKIEVYSKENHEKIKDELREDETRVFVRERGVIQQTIEKTVFSGADILEKTRRIAGKFIPIVPVYAYRSFVDGTERYYGIVRKLKDPQRVFNTQISQLTENAASAGQEVQIFLREQVQNPEIQRSWADKNNAAYRVIDPATDEKGNIVALGPVGVDRPGALDPNATALLSIIPNYIKDTTGFFPGEAINKEISGKLAKILMKRENMNTRIINKNIESAIILSGDIYQAIADEIYTTPRMVRTLQRDGTDGMESLLAPVMDTETGQFIESNDLRNKKFKAYADSGPQYDSIREETVEDMKAILEILPNIPGGEEYAPVVLTVLMDNIIGTGLDPLKEFNRNKMLTLGIVKPNTDEEKQLLAQQQQAAQQPDPQKALVEAATQQQISEARNLDAASAEKIANKGLKEAQTAKVIAEIGQGQERVDNDARKLLLEARKQAREQLSQLPIGQNTPIQ